MELMESIDEILTIEVKDFSPNRFLEPVLVKNAFSREECEEIEGFIRLKLPEDLEVNGSEGKLQMKRWEFFEKVESTESESSSIYLKDVHLERDCGESFYRVPSCFEPDWMNHYQKTVRQDDFRFVYWGGKGSWTPLHTDVLATHSWSANLHGKKLWIFWPPDANLDASKNYESTDSFLVNPERFPAPKFKCLQEERGAAIFVPSQWFHTVYNLESTLSINQNWANESNVIQLAQLLVDGLTDVEREIQHLRDEMDQIEWSETTHRLLRANLGMDGHDFLDYIRPWKLMHCVLIESALKILQDDGRFDVTDAKN